MYDNHIADLADNIASFIKYVIMDTLTEEIGDVPATCLVMSNLKYLDDNTNIKHSLVDIEDTLFNNMIKEVGLMLIKASNSKEK